MFRVTLTKYIPEAGVIYIDSIMRAFSTYDGAAETMNKFIEATIEDYNEVFKKDGITSQHIAANYPNELDNNRFAVLSIVKENNGKTVETPILLIDIFEIEKTDKGYKYREDFFINKIDENGEIHYDIYLNETTISVKENLAEALFFIDTFIHSHTICEAINCNAELLLGE